MQSGDRAGRAAGVSSRGSDLWIPSLALAAGYVLLISTWFDRAYNHDDFYTSYLAWLRSSGLEAGTDYYFPNFTPLADLASPLFYYFPESFLPLLLGKWAMLITAGGLLATTILIARRLGASDASAVLAAVFVLWQPTFIERISDIRADPIGTLLSMLAVLFILSGRYGVAGVAFGGALAISYKLALAGPFMLAGVILAQRSKPWRGAVRFVGLTAVLPSAYYVWRLVVDGPEMFLQISRQVATGIASDTSVRTRTLLEAFRETPLVFVILFVGLIAILVDRSGSGRGTLRAYALLTTLFTMTFIGINPMIFPYNLIIFLPVIAPFVVGMDQILSRAAWRLAKPLFLSAASIIGVSAGIGAMLTPSHLSRKSQERVIEWTWTALDPHEAAFDWQGMHFGRPGIYHWWIYSGTIREYQSGRWYDLQEEWRRAQIRLILHNYRLNWITPRDRQFLASHFVTIDRCISVPGWTFSAEQTVQGIEFQSFLHDAEYRWIPARPPNVEIDGRIIGDVVTLDSGRHVVTVPEGTNPSRFSLVHVDPDALKLPPPCPTDAPLLGGF